MKLFERTDGTCPVRFSRVDDRLSAVSEGLGLLGLRVTCRGGVIIPMLSLVADAGLSFAACSFSGLFSDFFPIGCGRMRVTWLADALTRLFWV